METTQIATTLTGPTETGFFADHDTDVLRGIVESKTADSLAIALGHGADHPLSVEAMRIANAAWGQLVLRGEA